MYRKILIIAAMASVGCFSRSFVNKDDGLVRMQAPSTPEVDAEIARARSVRPQLAFPCRVAVHFQQPGGSWRWTPEDKAGFDSVASALTEAGVASDVFALSQLTLPENERNPDLTKLRVAAAKHGADILCIIQGTTDVKTERNPASVFYLTIVGGFVVPGTNCDARFTMVGSLVDVRNGYLYAAVEEEESATIYRPTFVLEESTAIEKAKKKAVARFYPEWKKRLLSLPEVFAGCTAVYSAPATPGEPVTATVQPTVMIPPAPAAEAGPRVKGDRVNLSGGSR